MQPTSLGFRTDLALLQLGGTLVEDRGDHLVVRSPHNPDHWWGNFLLLPQVPANDDAQSWLDCFARTFPAAEHVAIGFDGTDGTADELRWFTERGFSAEAQAVLTATAVLPPARVNPEAVCRPLATDQDWAQSVELEMRCNDLGEYDAYRRYATARVATSRAMTEAGHGQWFGAFLGGRLVSQLGLLLRDRPLPVGGVQRDAGAAAGRAAPGSLSRRR